MKKQKQTRLSRLGMASLAALCLLLAACGEPTGMERPLDGSSVEAFNQSMEQYRQELTAADFSRLKSSVNYLQLKAFDAPTIADFYAGLDGKTPVQIIAQADAARGDDSNG